MTVAAPRAALLVAWMVAVIAGPRLGLAEMHEDCPGGPFAVYLIDAPFVGPQRDELVTQLRTALRARGIYVCTGPRATLREAIAIIAIANGGDARFFILARGADFTRRAERTVDLASLPPDGRPLALALAIDELVRASWAELLRADAPLEKPELPEVEGPIAPEPAAPVPSARRVELGAGASGEMYGRGSDHLGGDVFAIFWAVPQLGIDARAGLRAVSTAPVSDGDVRSNALVIAIGPTVRLMTIRDCFGLDFAEQLAFVHLRFTGEAKWPAVGVDGAATAIYAKSRLRGWVAMHPGLRLVAEAGVGASLRSVQVVAGDVAVAGAHGTQLSGTLGVAGVF